MVTGQRYGALLFNGYRVYLGNDDQLLDIASENDINMVNVLNATDLYTYQWLKL